MPSKQLSHYLIAMLAATVSCSAYAAPIQRASNGVIIDIIHMHLGESANTAPVLKHSIATDLNERQSVMIGTASNKFVIEDIIVTKHVIQDIISTMNVYEDVIEGKPQNVYEDVVEGKAQTVVTAALSSALGMADCNPRIGQPRGNRGSKQQTPVRLRKLADADPSTARQSAVNRIFF